jgi:GNAT superfamily N-acetyltransferase
MPAFEKFIIEPLDPAKHRREEFDCGVPALDDFLKLRARKEMEAGISACFVVVPEEEPGCIAGFYSLSAAVILRTDLPDFVTKKLPRYLEMPATLLGRLARDIRFRGQGIGDRLMASVLHRSVAASVEVASWAIVTDPKDQAARSFYEGFGFQPLTEQRLYLTIKQAAAFLSAP